MAKELQPFDYTLNDELHLEQFKNSPKLKGVVSLWESACAEAEGALFEVRNEFWLEGLLGITTDPTITPAIGIQLDYIGEIYNIPRTIGESDDQYRFRLAAGRNKSYSGTPEDVMNFIRQRGPVDSIRYYGPDVLGKDAAFLLIYAYNPITKNVAVLDSSGNYIRLPTGEIVVIQDISEVVEPTLEEIEAVSPAGVEVIIGQFLQTEDNPDVNIVTEAGINILIY